MTEIRRLKKEDMREAIELKAICYPEEVVGPTQIKPDVDNELAFFLNWMKKAEENNELKICWRV